MSTRRVTAALLLALVVLAPIAACSDDPPDQEAVTSASSTAVSTAPTAPATRSWTTDGLAGVAEPHGIAVGVAVDPSAYADEPAYASIVQDEYAMVTPENVMKFGPIHPEPDVYDWTGADAVVDLAEANGQQVRGHTLVWHSQLADWVEPALTDPATAEAILREHIATVVGRYRGRIAQWDVVNEAIADDGTWRDTPWYRALGPDYLRIAFEAAREADPDVALFYNDYGLESPGPKQDAAFDLVSDLLATGVPIDGIGFQSHFLVPATVTPEVLTTTFSRFASLGLAVAVTELDVAIIVPPDAAGTTARDQQYAAVAAACRAVEACRTMVLWGVDNAHSWVPGFFAGFGDALPFDAGGAPNSAYESLHAALAAPA